MVTGRRASHNLASATHETKVFHTLWKEFVLLEYIKTQDGQGVRSYLGLRPFILPKKTWINTLIQPFPDGGEKKKVKIKVER